MAAEDGFMKSQYTVANCYAHGRGTKRNFKKALELHKELADKGYIKSMLYVGEAYYNGDGAPTDAAEGVKYLRMGAEKEDALCEYYMGDAYTAGRGVEKDPRKAEQWYKRAASHGHILSRKILDAKGVAYGGSDAESPFESFLRKAKSGDAQSMYIVGRYYEDGIGIDADIDQAKVWYGSAAKKGNEAAKRALADIRAREQK
ncbi:hypothetical protein AUQ37_02330 [Candidatus Methanomethylophilus sp. 1R26]|uniref:tetratricopeptide repeat protein n=1 Tax=Candidatus Methanomethylophilus sp. 1R26 TaxID=1769296 RepID=UPI000736ED5F|nr:tetratricopeptide repeat protein [Candidatus Methanomethylophilus sp. 1R26]KUE73292.1 hypothetical protein AUQ37_02330 [Candidatus Methanomethylophilus sp. 1R26]